MSILVTRNPADDVELAQLKVELTGRCSDLRRPAVVEWPGQPMIGLHRGIPWWVGAADDDPLRDHRGRLPVPREARVRLAELAAHDLPFQRIAVAHELDPAGPVRELLPDLRRGPRPCPAETARLLVGPPPPHPGVRRAARVLERLVGAASSATSGLVETLLDPIVFGVAALRTPRPGDPTLWFPLVDWSW
jgi:hypothetical protein